MHAQHTGSKGPALPRDGGGSQAGAAVTINWCLGGHLRRCLLAPGPCGWRWASRDGPVVGECRPAPSGRVVPAALRRLALMWGAPEGALPGSVKACDGQGRTARLTRAAWRGGCGQGRGGPSLPQRASPPLGGAFSRGEEVLLQAPGRGSTPPPPLLGRPGSLGALPRGRTWPDVVRGSTTLAPEAPVLPASWLGHPAGSRRRQGCEAEEAGLCQVSSQSTARGLRQPSRPHQPLAALESPPPHPRSCSGTTTPGPTDPSPEHASAPGASPGPEGPDTSCQAPAAEGDIAPRDACEPDSEPLLGAAVGPLPGGGAEAGEEECPVCTEPYGPGEHRLALLNCGHGLCTGCLDHLLRAAPGADVGRVRCPLCRQKTPMIEWEICRLQEELLRADGPQRPPPPAPPAPPRHGPGPWASLEHRYRLRFLVGPAGGGGCLPFLPCSACLGARLWALRERGPCARRLALLGLLALELLGLLLGLTPLLLLGLLLALLDHSHR